MVIAMIAMGMMQMSIDQIIDVITVRHSFVSAIGTMYVTCIMTTATVRWRASVGIGFGNVDFVFDDLTVLVNVVQVTVVQVVDVVAMLDSSVFTIGAVLMVVILVTVRHRLPF